MNNVTSRVRKVLGSVQKYETLKCLVGKRKGESGQLNNISEVEQMYKRCWGRRWQ